MIELTRNAETAMSRANVRQLEPAGFWNGLISSLIPKRLDVEVQTQSIPDGTVEVIPIFTIDGHLVAPELLCQSESQSVLGYSVSAGTEALTVLKETGGRKTRLSKHKAASFIGQMTQRGVRLKVKGKNAAPQVNTVKPELELELREDDSLQINSRLVTPQGIVVEKPTSLAELSKDNGWYVANEDLYKVETAGELVDPLILSGSQPSSLDGDAVPRFLQEIARQETHFEAIEKNERLAGLNVYGDRHEDRLRVSGDHSSIHVDPALVYFGKCDQAYQPTPDGIKKAVRAGSGFDRIPEGWIEIRPEVVATHQKAVVELRDRLGHLDEIRGTKIPETLKVLLDPTTFSTPWAVYFSAEVKNTHRLVDTSADTRFTLNIVESNGRALLELDPRYNHERFRVSHAEVHAAVNGGEEWIRRNDAWIKIDRKRFDKVSKAIASNGLEQTPSGVRFPASRREEVIAIFSRLGTIEHSESYARFLEQLSDFEKIEPALLPHSLRPAVKFRPYQQHGYNWLAFLRKYGLNGILADDMGLGKTLQTLAVVRMEQERSGSQLPTLIICPTSLVTNWRKEAVKFFEGFEIRAYTGSGREKVLLEIQQSSPSLFDSVEESGLRGRNFLVITSFGIALRDQEALSNIPWLYIIVDEAHHIKNPNAQRTRAIKTINGQYKLALTGTPIQNNLDELWTLFDFVMPGFLGSRGRFRQQYSTGKNVDWTAVHDPATGLKKRIHPFLLRRLKQDVANDLPEKVLIKLPVELAPAQVKLYKETLKSAAFRKLLEAVDAKGVQRASTEILAIYTRLRSICNHPAVGVPTPEGRVNLKDSGKLAALQELIAEVKEGGHRALLFCQSTKMLDIIGQFLKEWGVAFLRLDGSTAPSTRQELVDEFNRDESLTVFLISTKAGGTGLNLTGADTVIFYDHDWNPANDSQAQDRAYRIGQTRKVTVYKLVSVGTIEEQIIERQELKQTLADQLIGTDSEGFKDLTKEQLLSLFQYRG